MGKFHSITYIWVLKEIASESLKNSTLNYRGGGVIWKSTKSQNYIDCGVTE